MAKKSLLRALFGKKRKAVKKIVRKPARKKIIVAKKKPIVAKKPVKKRVKAEKVLAKKVIKPEKAKPELKKIKEAKKAAEKILPHIEKISDEKAIELLKSYSIPVPQHFFVKNEKDLLPIIKKLGFPLVMKVSGEIIHKTDAGGVKIINTEDEAKRAFDDLKKIKGCEKILVQKFCSGIETIAGAKWDEQFGGIVVFGLGGIYTEVLKDVSFRVCPLAQQDAEKMVRGIKGYEILKGVRGQKPINFQALYDVLVKISKLAIREKIKEMDINPLFCNEQGCCAADVRIVKR